MLLRTEKGLRGATPDDQAEYAKFKRRLQTMKPYTTTSSAVKIDEPAKCYQHDAGSNQSDRERVVMATAILGAPRPCVKCGSIDRNSHNKCRVCKRIAGAAYRAANPSKVKAATAICRAANPDKTKDTSAAYRAANLDSEKARKAAYYAANPEANRIHNQNRRARKQETGGVLSKGLFAKLFKLQRGKCACCSLPLGDNPHMDHIMPIALGGRNEDGNIQLLRQRCNHQKHAKHPIDFMQSRGCLL